MTACTVVAGLVIGVLAAVAFRHYTRPAAGGAAASQRAAVRAEAARWVAQQVGRDATVSCDRVMCAALRTHGFPGGRLMTLGPTSDPPNGTDVVVETPAVRALFGSSLDAAWAPAVLASFGSAADRIAVRVIAPHGVAVYQVLLRADLAARKRAGAALLHDPRVTASSAAAGQLTGGLVDARLLAALAALAGLHPLDITGFGRPSPGASAGVPLRSAVITGAAPPGSRHPVSPQGLMVILHAQRSPYLPSSLDIVRIPPGGAVLRIGYPVPSPLGLLGPGG